MKMNKEVCSQVEEGRRSSYSELSVVSGASPASSSKESRKNRRRESRILRKIKTVKELETDPELFNGDGINYKAKIIGTEPVGDARGNRMCQGALQRLKAAVKNSGDHKHRILLNISLKGIMIKDEKTGELLHHHPIHKISFISQDVSDNRAFGYVFGCPRSGHEFFGLKTEKMAAQVVVTLRNLFLTALDIKQKELENEQQEIQNPQNGSHVINGHSSKPKPPERDFYSNVVCLPDPECPPVDTLLDLHFSVDSLQQGISQMEQSIASQNLGISFSEDEVSTFKLDRHLSSLYQETLSLSSRSSSTSDYNPVQPDEPPPPQEDRYAVFLDMDSTPSIFDNPHIVALPEPLPANMPQVPPVQEKTNGVTNGEVKKDDVFAKLDPLGNQPFVDKKDFFQDFKQPPKTAEESQNPFAPPKLPPKRAAQETFDSVWNPFNPFSAPPPSSPPPPPPRPQPRSAPWFSFDQPPLPSPARKISRNPDTSSNDQEWSPSFLNAPMSPPLPPKPSHSSNPESRHSSSSLVYSSTTEECSGSEALLNASSDVFSSPPGNVMSPDSIFRRKSDPFADDFFLSVGKSDLPPQAPT